MLAALAQVPPLDCLLVLAEIFGSTSKSTKDLYQYLKENAVISVFKNFIEVKRHLRGFLDLKTKIPKQKDRNTSQIC